VHEKIQDKKCQLCDYAASATAELSKHVQTVHSKIKDNKCLNCDYTAAKCSKKGPHCNYVFAEQSQEQQMSTVFVFID
jgi:hypothetical protein